MRRRTACVLTCLAGLLVLCHTVAAGGLVLATAQQPEAPPPATFARLVEHHETLAIDDARIELTFHLSSDTSAASRVVDRTKRVLPRLVAWFGPLPTPRLTVADLPWTPRGGCVAAPGVVAIRGRWLQPESDSGLERALIAALVRQSFVALGLGKDDGFVEGLARYATVRVVNDALEGEHFLTERFFGGFVPHTFRSIPLSRRSWDSRPFVRQFELQEASVPCANARDVRIDQRAQAIMVGLLSLERVIGWASLQSAIATLTSRAAGRTATAADLMAILLEGRGAALVPTLAAALFDGSAVDYAIDELASQRNATGGAYRTLLRVRKSEASPATAASPTIPSCAKQSPTRGTRCSSSTTARRQPCRRASIPTP